VFRRGAPQPVVLGKLAVVSAERAALRIGRDGDSRVLSVVEQGTYLALVSEVGDHYGVLMVDRTTGWVPKAALRKIEYQVAVANPDDLAPQAPQVPDADGSYPDAGSLPEGLDARTVALLREAFTYLGVPYVWAGNTRAGLDCSGFVKNVFATQGVILPRHSGDQARVGMPVEWQDLQAGDRLYFDMGNKGRISHTGIYLGNGYFIHASSNQKKVGVDHILKPNYYKALVAARRS
jgi:cell wall-associated NlpC family hydrolase